jgi:hypothetical protein
MRQHAIVDQLFYPQQQQEPQSSMLDVQWLVAVMISKTVCWQQLLSQRTSH